MTYIQTRLRRPDPRFSLFLLDPEAKLLRQLLLRALREAEEEECSTYRLLLDKLQPSLIPLNEEELRLLKRLLWELRAELRLLILKDRSLERRRIWRQLHRLCERILEQVRWVQRSGGRLPDFRYRQLSLGEFIPGVPDRPRPRFRPPKLTPEEEERMKLLRMVLEPLIEAVAGWLAGVDIQELKESERRAMEQFGIRKDWEEP